MMKVRHPLIATFVAGSLVFSGALLAQDQSMPPVPPPPPAPAAPMPPAPPAAPTPSAPSAVMPASMPSPPPPPGGTQANTSTPRGQQVTINSSVPPVNPGAAPSFEQLSGGTRYITEDQASAYPLLANDFLYVDKGHTGHITKAQYERWLANK